MSIIGEIWEEKYDKMETSYKNKISKLEEKLKNLESNSSDITGDSPQVRYENLKKYFVEQVEKIDSEVHWSPIEPIWWSEMIDFMRKMK